MVVQARAIATPLPDHPSFVRLCDFCEQASLLTAMIQSSYLGNIKLSEAPATDQVVLRLFQALVLQECLNNRPEIFAHIISHLYPPLVGAVSQPWLPDFTLLSRFGPLAGLATPRQTFVLRCQVAVSPARRSKALIPAD